MAISAINNDSDHGSTASHNYFSGSHTDLSNIGADDHHAQDHDNSDHTTNYLPESDYTPEADTHSRPSGTQSQSQSAEYSDSTTKTSLAFESGDTMSVEFPAPTAAPSDGMKVNIVDNAGESSITLDEIEAYVGTNYTTVTLREISCSPNGSATAEYPFQEKEIDGVRLTFKTSIPYSDDFDVTVEHHYPGLPSHSHNI